ncbi:intraflagellar transport-associated protein isoform X2 [Trichechus manatus latirostris]|uniref:Intraflagellar transport-associated protein isoform X2 n=1 Tax=Trichechus manatus latirostris TaxID=127582 RepID=A0A2Y9RQI6_TRIMA|nr:intraflagellar transport-associated protein isoform X2 [Trichechus manatus latirostris]
MPAKISGLEIMDEDRLIEEVLDKFVNCHEQTYEEFLSTFTHLSKDLLLLPGEVEQYISTSAPSYIPSVDQILTPEVKPSTTTNRAGKPMEELLGDEVHPFSLDEEFDYDKVMLTPKFTSAEMDTIKQLSKQKKENPNGDLEEPHD